MKHVLTLLTLMTLYQAGMADFEINADGTYTYTALDSNGTTTKNYDSSGNLTSETSTAADGSTTSKNYDASGNLTSETSTTKDGVTTATTSNEDGSTTTEKTDKNGNVISSASTTADGTTTVTNYNSSGKVISTSTIDANGAQTAEATSPDGTTTTRNTNPDGTTDITKTDANGNVISTTTITTNANGKKEGTTTDADGNVVSTTTFSTTNGVTTATTTDADGTTKSQTIKSTEDGAVIESDSGIQVYSAKTGNVLTTTGDGKGSAQSGTTGLTISRKGVTTQDGASVKLGDNINKLKSQKTDADFEVVGNTATSTNTDITATNNFVGGYIDDSSLIIEGDTITLNEGYTGIQYQYSGKNLDDFLSDTNYRNIEGTNSETGNTIKLYSDDEGYKQVSINGETILISGNDSSFVLNNPNTGMQISNDDSDKTYTIQTSSGNSIEKYTGSKPSTTFSSRNETTVTQGLNYDTGKKTYTITRGGQSKTF